MELTEAQDPQLSDQNQVRLGSGQVGKGRPWVPRQPAGTAPLLRVPPKTFPILLLCPLLNRALSCTDEPGGSPDFQPGKPTPEHPSMAMDPPSTLENQKTWVCSPSPGGHPCLLPLSEHNKQRNLTLLTDSHRDSGAVCLDVSETRDPTARPPVQPEIFNKVKPSGSRGCHGPVPPCSSRWNSLKPASRLPPSPQSLSCHLARLTF